MSASETTQSNHLIRTSSHIIKNFMEHSIMSLDGNLFTNNPVIVLLNFNENQINSIGRNFLSNVPLIDYLFLLNNQCVNGAWTISSEVDRERINRTLSGCFENAPEPPTKTPVSPTTAPESRETPEPDDVKHYMLELRGSLTLRSENGSIVLFV